MQVNIKNHVFDVCDTPADYWGWIGSGRYDHEWAVYDKYLTPEHTFVDCGAWIGAHSLYASKTAKRVIAVEPDPVAFAIAEKNLRGFDLRRLAITSYTGELKLGSAVLGASTTRTNPDEGGTIGRWADDQICTAPCTTIAALCESLPDPLFVKLDVEGSEEEILKDLAFFESRRPRVLIELHPFWWRNESATFQRFDALTRLYHAESTPHPGSNTWILA